MNDIDVKTCVVCHTEKSIDNFYSKYREYKQCNIKSVLKRYYNNEDVIFQEPLDEYAHFKDLDKTLKTLEEPKRN